MIATDNKQIKFAIFIIFIIIIWLIYSFIYKFNSIRDNKFIEIPYDIKCYFKEKRCEEGNIDILSIIYGLMFFFLGLILPGYYLTVIIAAIIIEVIQQLIGNGSRYIINPLIAITSYMIGSVLSPKKNYKKKYI